MNIVNFRCLGRGIVGALALSFTQLLAGPVMAAGYDVGPLHISDPWARATPKGAADGAGYMTVANSGTATERLNCVSSDASAKCEIHQMTMTDGVMKMRLVAGGLEIKPGETVMLKPGGYHIMFLDLKEPLVKGGKLEATFKIDDGTSVQVDFPIAPIGAPVPGGSGGGHMMMDSPHMMQMNKQ